jgi:hypothetical protein
LAALPTSDRIGIVADRDHLPAIEGTAKEGPILAEQDRRRIVKTAHFRGGRTRGVNEWSKDCDVLIVLGTPRINPSGVRTRLRQLGQASAADQKFEWGSDCYSGISDEGRRLTIKTKAYRNRQHRAAYDSLVKAELLQSVGRGRSICEQGCPVIVVTTEILGYPIVDPETLMELNESERKVLESMQQLSDTAAIGNRCELSDTSTNKYLLAGVSLSSSEIATHLGRDLRHTQRTLAGLERKGFVQRVGERGGWTVSHKPPASVTLGRAAGALQEDANTRVAA